MAEAARFVRGPETTALVSELRKLAPGEFVSTSALSAAVGFDVTRYEGNVQRAREIVRRDGGGVIDVAEGGLRRLTDAEAVNMAAPRYLAKARAAGERSAEALTSVDYDGLGATDKIKHNVGLSLAGALRLAISPRARRRVTGIVTSTGAVLPSGDMVKLFEKVK